MPKFAKFLLILLLYASWGIIISGSIFVSDNILEKELILDNQSYFNTINVNSPNSWGSRAITSIDDFTVWHGTYHSHTALDNDDNQDTNAGNINYICNYADSVDYMDFLGITPHIKVDSSGDLESFGLNSESTYLTLKQTTAAYTSNNPGFVALAGYEWSPSISSGDGHMNIFNDDQLPIEHNSDAIYNPTSPADVDDDGYDIYNYVMNKNNDQIMMQWNHPDGYQYGCNGSSWYRPEVDDAVACIEVINGPAYCNQAGEFGQDCDSEDISEFENYLDMGWHIGVSADQDNHYGTWGASTSCRTGVVSYTGASLNAENILDGYYNHRTYASHDINYKFMFTANDWWMGQKIGGSSTIDFVIYYDNPSETISNGNKPYSTSETANDYITEIAIFGERNGFGSALWSTNPSNTSGRVTASISSATEGEWFVVRTQDTSALRGVRTFDTMWSSPVWYEPSDPDGIPSSSGIDNKPSITGTTANSTSPLDTESVKINCTVTDDNTLDSIKLRYSKNSGSTWTNVTMSDEGGDLYEAIIAAQPNGTTVWYYVEAIDNASQVATDPSGAPSNYYSYYVGPAEITSGPTITSRGIRSITIEWTTNKAATSIVEYDTNGFPYGSYVNSSNSYVTAHKITLEGLSRSTTYYFRVGSVDEEENSFWSSDSQFTTRSISENARILLDHANNTYFSAYLNNFTSILENVGYSVTVGNLEHENLDNYEIVVLWGPSDIYSISMHSTIADWTKNGGALLLLDQSDYSNYDSEQLNDFLDALGCTTGRFNDDEIYDPTDNSGSAYNVQFLSSNGCFNNDSYGITEGMTDITSESVMTLYHSDNESPELDEVIIIHGDSDAYNNDEDGEDLGMSYTAGSYPPVLAALPAIGSYGGRLAFGGLAKTFSDRNSALESSDVDDLIERLINWLWSENASMNPNNAPPVDPDYSKPQITINTADDQHYTSNPTVDIDFSDNEALDDAFYQIDSYSGSWSAFVSDVGTNIYNHTENVISDEEYAVLDVGLHTIYLKCTDSSNNVQGEPGNVSWTFYKDSDLTNPNIVINSANNQNYSSNPSIDIKFSDNEALDDAFYQINSYSGSWSFLFSNQGSTSYNFIDTVITTSEWNNLNKGEHTIYFKCNDTTNNFNGSDGSVYWTFNKDIDEIDPIITINTAGNQNFTANPIIDIDFSDNTALDDAYYQINSYSDSWNSLFSNQATTTYNHSSTIMSSEEWEGLSLGSHTLYFKCNDSANNEIGSTGEYSWTFIKDEITEISDIYDLKITEILYNPSSSQAVSDECEWFEIYNSGLTSVSLTNAKIKNTSGGTGIPSSFSGASIEAGEYIVVTKLLIGINSFEAYWGDNSGTWGDHATENYDVYEWTLQILTNSPVAGITTVQLLDAENSDAVAYSATYDDAWDSLADGSGYSLELVDYDLAWSSGNFDVYNDGTPGSQNSSVLEINNKLLLPIIICFIGFIIYLSRKQLK